MNKQQLEGKWDQAKGKVKREYGDVVDDPAKQGEGIADQVKGKAKELYGDAKEALEKRQREEKKKKSA